MIDQLVLLGAGGDLVARLVTPALVRMHAVGQLPDTIEIVAVARDEHDSDSFRRYLTEQLDAYAPDLDEDARDAVLDRTSYHRADVTDPDQLAGAFDRDRPAVAYLALPPAVFGPAIDALADLGLAEDSRVVVEKPFGQDLASARELNALLHRSFAERCIHRIDHFLGLQTVQNLLGLRFANRMFEPVWNCNHIERVDIVWDETLTLEGRAGYYDGTGALRDMVQNHLLQVLALVAMEPPVSLDEQDLRSRKAQVLREVRRLNAEEAAARSLRARYTAGRIGERDVPAYLDEDGVDPDQDTETLAELTVEIDNWRWSGVPFRLRAGKALGRDRHEVVIRFREVPHLAFGDDQVAASNELHLEFEPDQLRLRVNVSGPGDPFTLEQVDLTRDLAGHGMPAYARVLRSILEGDPTLSIRDDEAERSWEIVEPVLAAWREGASPMLEYAAGSEGPQGGPKG